MALEIFKLIGSIMVDSEDANKSLAKTDKKAEGLGHRFSEAIESAGKLAAGVGAVATAAGAAIFKVASDSAAASDEIDKMSQKIGISRQSYQELDYILSQNGMDVNQLQSSMKKLTSQMQSARDGSKTAMAAFDALGVAVTNSDGSLRSQEDVLFDTIAALQSMDNEAERAAIANDVLGRAASELAPLLNAGAGSMEELRQKAHDLGIVLNDEIIDSGVKFTDTMDNVKRSMGAAMTQIGAGLMPIIQQLLDWVLAHMPEIQATCETVFRILAIVVENAGVVVKWLMDKFGEYFPIIQGAVQDAFGKIQFYWNNTLKPCFDAIGGFITNTLWPTFKSIFHGFIVPMVQTAFNAISQLWEGTLKPVFNGIITFITGVFSGNWRKAWEGIKSIFTGIANGIGVAFKYPINQIINLINGFLGGLNKIRIPDWVPVVGGRGFSIPKIPNLARGGVLEKGQVGLLEGNGAEAVVPLESNKRWISKVAEDMEIAVGGKGSEKIEALLQEILRLLEKLKDMGIYLDGGKLVGLLAPGVDRELGRIQARRTGEL